MDLLQTETAPRKLILFHMLFCISDVDKYSWSGHFMLLNRLMKVRGICESNRLRKLKF